MNMSIIAPRRRTPLLFLCHRIPYPPNKGDKIRAFHLLHHLAQAFDVHLATFIDDPADRAWRGDVEKHCVSAYFADLAPGRATLLSLRGLLTGDPLTLPYYASRAMKRWVRDTVAAEGIRHVIVYSSAMAQFLPAGAAFRRKVIDFVDIDSDKWLQYARQKPWPLSWVYRREGQRLLRYEQALARSFDAGLFVSAAEARHFRRLSPETAHKIGFYCNGVNADYFAPGPQHANPYPDGRRALVFTGAMDYWPNVEAVSWFARDVFPLLQRRYPELIFFIVGGNPTPAVRKLAQNPAVTVTGRVPDVRPYLNHALAAVAPMRVARGIQNKVLEGMAMARPVLVSELGFEGIDDAGREHVIIAESAGDYCRAVGELLAGMHPELGSGARAYVRRAFNWDDNLPEVAALLGDAVAAGPPADTDEASAHG
jgi:sugar transferase (PEP-CTERM/EpsH1 system associated)